MALKNDRYTYRVTWDEDDGEYVGLCAEFPSLSWLAKAPEAALKGIRKVAAEVVEDMKRSGEKVPEPFALVSENKRSGHFKLRKASFKGNGLQPHLAGASWGQIREMGC